MDTQTPWYRRHLDAVGESYWTHARTALWMAGNCFVTALVLVIHAIVPCCFERTGSTRIRAMGRFVDQRSPVGDADGAR